MNNIKKIEKYIFQQHNSLFKHKDLTWKKLTYLLYYCQAWSLVLNKRKSFLNEIKANLCGPFISSIFDRYKHFMDKQIEIEDIDFNSDSIDKKDKELIDNVVEQYGKYDEEYLQHRIHIEKPWIDARFTRLKIINVDKMKKYYKDVYDNYKEVDFSVYREFRKIGLKTYKY